MESSSKDINHRVVKPELTQLDFPKIPLENSPNVSRNKTNSIFSLTVDEFEDRSGKNFGAMNMDDLLNDLWNAEEISNTNQQNNSFTIPNPVCNKNLEEVWDEITGNGSPQKNLNKGLHQVQQTLGEMTLEDFLIKVGVIRDGSALIPQPKPKESDQNFGVYLGPFNGQGSMMTGLEHSQSTHENNMVVNVAPMYPMYTTSEVFVGEGSNNIGKNGSVKFEGVQISENNNGRENGRPSSDRVELAWERRQRRMIKNRESAARSRARKNAYTCELEHELDAQRRENEMLKLMLAESENKRKQEVLKDQSSTKARQREEKSKTMRRTLSVGW